MNKNRIVTCTMRVLSSTSSDTQATLLLASGEDIKTVQARLGHAKASTTLDMYAHAMPEKDKEAAQLIGNLLSGKQGVVKG